MGLRQALGSAILHGAVIGTSPRERRAVLCAFVYFFSLLCSYYLLRPVRDEMGISAGVENLPWLFTGTFIVMLALVPLFGWAGGRFDRGRLIPVVYGFFGALLLLFYLAFGFREVYAATAALFFVWVSVFNLFVVSVFWSFMADIFDSEQAKRLFGFIAAGGSAGAVTGPMIATALASMIGVRSLLLASICFLAMALLCVEYLNRHEAGNGRRDAAATEPLEKGIWRGLTRVLGSRHLLGISLFIWLYTLLATILYFEQAHLVKAALDDGGQRTALFAAVDLAVNVLTLVIQLFVTGRVMQRFGVGAALAVVPLLMAFGFLALGAAAVLTVLIPLQIIRRSGNYAVTRPAREVLFTVVDRESRYKAKNFIDTVVYRGGDALSGWLFALLIKLGLSLGTIAWLAVPLALLWAVTGVNLGRSFRRHEREESQ